MKTCTLLATLLAAAVLAGCGGDDAADDTAGSSVPQTSGIAAGPALSIDDVLAADSDEPLLVAGNLLALGDEVRLCSALAESFPPQCAGASLHVDGLDLAEVDGLITEGDVSWTDRPVELLGVVEDETLTVSENVL
jgi:hypothetical protein